MRASKSLSQVPLWSYSLHLQNISLKIFSLSFSSEAAPEEIWCSCFHYCHQWGKSSLCQTTTCGNRQKSLNCLLRRFPFQSTTGKSATQNILCMIFLIYICHCFFLSFYPQNILCILLLITQWLTSLSLGNVTNTVCTSMCHSVVHVFCVRSRSIDDVGLMS